MARVKTHDLEAANGYQKDFLGAGLEVELPELSEQLKEEVAPVKGEEIPILHYHNYSIIQNAIRRFPFFTAANINGEIFKDLNRKDIFPGGRDRWRKDRRISFKHQWGMELYSAEKSDFDRGHMTRREDVQWGFDNLLAKIAAQSTFFFTNAVPQHPALNQDIWSNLEDYILHKGSVANDLRITLMTGPALRKDDPFFVTSVRDAEIQIPVLFWKVIFFTQNDGTLSRIGFLMSQKEVLEAKQIIRLAPVDRGIEDLTPPEMHFLNFKEADLYQVSVDLIEELTDLRFTPAVDPQKNRDPAQLVLKKVEVPLGTRSLDGQVQNKIEIEGLRL